MSSATKVGLWLGVLGALLVALVLSSCDCRGERLGVVASVELRDGTSSNFLRSWKQAVRLVKLENGAEFATVDIFDAVGPGWIAYAPACGGQQASFEPPVAESQR